MSVSQLRYRTSEHPFTRTGLNLTSCSNVILVDMWWNPALEVSFIDFLEVTHQYIQQEQAFDRAHRFGQKRDVYIYKLMIEQTVEDRILLVSQYRRPSDKH